MLNNYVKLRYADGEPELLFFNDRDESSVSAVRDMADAWLWKVRPGLRLAALVDGRDAHRPHRVSISLFRYCRGLGLPVVGENFAVAPRKRRVAA